MYIGGELTIPYPGTTITDRASVKRSMTSSADTCCTVPCSAPSVADFCACCCGEPSPNPPMSTWATLRFIARHMTSVRMMPLQPTKAPVTTSALLESMKPAAEVLNPESEFKKLILTGMSPPPMAWKEYTNTTKRRVSLAFYTFTCIGLGWKHSMDERHACR